MSIVTTHQLYCDGCGEPFLQTVGTQGFPTAAKQRAQAKKIDGWVRVRRDGKMIDLCRDCKEAQDARCGKAR